MQFVAWNAGWKSLLNVVGPEPSEDWATFPLHATDGWARQILIWLHGSVPGADSWVGDFGTPDPLQWKWIPTYKEFRYCAVCASVAYHSPYHQYPWVTRCFVHPEQRIKTKTITGHFGETPAIAWSKVLSACSREDPAASVKRGDFPSAARTVVRRYDEMVDASRRVQWIGLGHRVRSRWSDVRNMAGDITTIRGDDAFGAQVPESLFSELVEIARTIAYETGFHDVADACMTVERVKRTKRTFRIRERSLLGSKARRALNPATRALLETFVAYAMHYRQSEDQYKEHLTRVLVAPEFSTFPPNRQHDRKLRYEEGMKIAVEVAESLSLANACPNSERALFNRLSVDLGTCNWCARLAKWAEATFGRPTASENGLFDSSWDARFELPFVPGPAADLIRRYCFRQAIRYELAREISDLDSSFPGRYQRTMLRQRSPSECVAYSWNVDELELALRRELDRLGRKRCRTIAGDDQ